MFVPTLQLDGPSSFLLTSLFAHPGSKVLSSVFLSLLRLRLQVCSWFASTTCSPSKPSPSSLLTFACTRTEASPKSAVDPACLRFDLGLVEVCVLVFFINWILKAAPSIHSSPTDTCYKSLGATTRALGVEDDDLSAVSRRLLVCLRLFL